MWPEDKFFVQRGEGPGGVPWVWIFQWTDYKRKRSDVLEPDSKIATSWGVLNKGTSVFIFLCFLGANPF